MFKISVFETVKFDVCQIQFLKAMWITSECCTINPYVASPYTDLINNYCNYPIISLVDVSDVFKANRVTYEM